MSEAPIILSERLAKTFVARGRGTVEAVRGIDLAVEEGEIFGLLGPNGAGKTTMMRMTVLTTTETSSIFERRSTSPGNPAT